MKNKELIEKLNEYSPDAEIWCSAYNGHTNVYASLDHVIGDKYGVWLNDFYGIPGKCDIRTLEGFENDDEVVVLGTFFCEYPTNYDFGSNDINYPIETINGVDGDSDIIWKINSFEKIEDIWSKETDDYVIHYRKKDKILLAVNKNTMCNVELHGDIGIEDLRNAIELLKINIIIMT